MTIWTRDGLSLAGSVRIPKPESARRAPFTNGVPRASKRRSDAELPEVPVHIRAASGELRPEDRAYIRRKLGRHLGKFTNSIERVSVRIRDVNGPRGGVDQMCRIKVVLHGLPSVVFEIRDASLGAAVDRALTGCERAVRRVLQRRRMRRMA